jgi:hypothetical protein
MEKFDFTLEITCTGKYVPARQSKFNSMLDLIEIGHCAHIENFKVFLGELEITKQLSAKQLSELETDYLITIEDSEVA